MIELIRKNGVLYAKVLLNLRRPINYKGNDYFKGEGLMLEVDAVHHLLVRNGDVRIYNGKDYIKLNFVKFNEILKKADYKAIDYVEPKKEEPVVQPKEEVKKEEPKVEPVVVKEEPKQQPVQEVKKEQHKQQNENNNNNKKQRHNNNNNNKQGGDK